MNAEKALGNSTFLKKNCGTNCTDMFKNQICIQIQGNVVTRMMKMVVHLGVPIWSIKKEIGM